MFPSRRSIARSLIPLLITLALAIPTASFAWNDITHMAVMKAAGLDDLAYLAVGADMAKEKAAGYEDGNHYRDNEKGVVVTANMVLDEARDYNCRCNDQGHLYGAIVAALTQYWEAKSKNKYSRYHLGFASHYIGDLSMPLHNVAYNDFNREHHSENDGAVEKSVRGATNERVAKIARNIQGRMKSLPRYQLPRAREDFKKFNYELAGKIAEIANKAMALGYGMQDANPPQTVMTVEEGYRQLAQSALLLQAAYLALQ